jgi:molybdopterin/thiamine biosynthesis adenylyltransferase
MKTPVQRPRIKFSHRPILLGHDRIRIGGVVHGIADIIDDPDGWVWALLELLDGSRTVMQVAADLRLSFPHRPAYEVSLAIDELVSAGHVEDADEPEPDGLTEVERERYSRSRELFQWMDQVPRRTSWDLQLGLKRAKVAVIGLGGVGSTAALALTASGIGHVHCVDRDVVTLSDLNRQLYTEQDLGHPKAEAAVRRLCERNSGVLVTGERRDIDDPQTVQTLATGFDVVVLAADNPTEIRSWTNRACHETGTPWVLGGYHGPLATVGLYRPGTGPCYDCARTAEQDRLAGLPPRTGWSPAVGISPPHAANATTAGMTGHLAAHAAISLLTGVPALPVNRQYAVNLVTLESYALGPEAPHPCCPTCGPQS